MHVSVPNDSCVLVHYIISALKMIKSAIYQKRKKMYVGFTIWAGKKNWSEMLLTSIQSLS